MLIEDKISFFLNEKGTINKIRKVLYKTARVLGDVNAAAKGKIGKRVVRRIAGKITGRILHKMD